MSFEGCSGKDSASSAGGHGEGRRNGVELGERPMPIGAEEKVEVDRRSGVTPHSRRRTVPTADAPAPPQGLLFGGEPENCRRQWRRFVPIMLNVGLLYAVFLAFRLEWPAFRRLSAAAFAALPIHYYLPYRFKKWFFIGLSMACLGLIFGAATTAAVVIAVLAVIGLTALPIAWSLRAMLLGIMGIAAAVARARTPALSAFETLWPILGSILVFRTIIYMYELKHTKRKEPLADVLGYFFLLPNFYFMHFPVVDYRTQLRGYFASDIHTIMRCGIRMIFKGVIQLLIYRIIYHDLLIKAEEVTDFAGLMRHLITNYLLYLHVSGQFHIACGMLHLFGFQLPETHHNYLLATGFTDYWRRINIYWKDFMVRLVFNPLVFRLKSRPKTRALSFAVACVFVTTWALHGLQSFWLRGSWGFSVQDGLFWGILGLLVMVNVQLDYRASLAPRRRPEASWRQACLRGLKVAGTLATISLLWSLWNSSGVSAWFSMFGRAFGVE